MIYPGSIPPGVTYRTYTIYFLEQVVTFGDWYNQPISEFHVDTTVHIFSVVLPGLFPEGVVISVFSSQQVSGTERYVWCEVQSNHHGEQRSEVCQDLPNHSNVMQIVRLTVIVISEGVFPAGVTSRV